MEAGNRGFELSGITDLVSARQKWPAVNVAKAAELAYMVMGGHRQVQ